MKELIMNEPLAIICLMLGAVILIFAVLSKIEAVSITDKYYKLIDRDWQPKTLEAQWLYDIGYEKLKGDEFYVRVVGVYGTPSKYEVYYHIVSRYFYEGDEDEFTDPNFIGYEEYSMSCMGFRNSSSDGCTGDKGLSEADIEKIADDFEICSKSLFNQYYGTRERVEARIK